MLEYILSKFPLSSSAFLAYALVGAGMLVAGTLDYGSYSTNLLAVGLACGAIGVPRAVTKVGQGIKSVNFLGFIESIPIPTVVFIVFAGASTVALATVSITFGAFTENLTKVGIACGAVQAARAIENVFGPFFSKSEVGEGPPVEPTPTPDRPPDPAPSA
jgi:hypothetical protein